MARRFESDESSSGPPPAAPVRTKNTHQFSPSNDAFEEEIAYSIAALDDIPESKYTSPKTSACSGAGDPGSLTSDEAPEAGLSSRGQRSTESDEVRIMAKVLGGPGLRADPANCVKALDLTDWNVHRAIKIVKLKALVKKSGVAENDMKVAKSDF